MNDRHRTGLRPSRLTAGTALLLAAAAAACASPATIPASVVPSVAPTDTAASVAPTDASPSELATAPPTSQEWVAVAPLRTARTGFDAVVLGDGSVLVVGDDRACEPGGAAAGSERAERYDGSADAWADVGSLNKPRKSFAMVTLADGSAMVLGGVNSDDVPFSSTKVYSAATGTWDSGPLMTLARAAPFAVTLRNGRVLVVSVLDPVRSIATSEVYDPSTGSWGHEAALPKRVLWLHALVALGDGGALAMGWSDEPDAIDSTHPSAFAYDGPARQWREVDAPFLQATPALVTLPDGSVLAIGGNDGGELLGGTGGPSRRLSRFDFASLTWQALADMPTERDQAQVALLGDGRVVVAGGVAAGGSYEGTIVESTDLYDPAADSWKAGPDLIEPRRGGQAVVLGDGSVLVLGGNNSFHTEGEFPWCPEPLSGVERFVPATLPLD